MDGSPGPTSIRPLSAELSPKSLGMVRASFRFLKGRTKSDGSPALGKLQKWSTQILKGTSRGYKTHYSTPPSMVCSHATGRMFVTHAHFESTTGGTKKLFKKNFVCKDGCFSHQLYPMWLCSFWHKKHRPLILA